MEKEVLAFEIIDFLLKPLIFSYLLLCAFIEYILYITIK